MIDFANDVCVVLVEPGESMNVGSAARALKNLGFRSLRLVAPREYEPARARITACWAEDILEKTLVFPDIRAATGDCTMVAGFAARTGKNRLEHFTLEPFLAHVNERLSTGAKLGLVFGPEETGLRNEHLEHCDCLVKLPSAPDCPAYNLSQAVLLALYEMRRSLGPLVDRIEREPTASIAELNSVDLVLNGLMRRSGFAREGTTPALVPGMLRQLFRRIAPSQRELGVLLGFLGRLNRVLNGESPGYHDDPANPEKRWMRVIDPAPLDKKS